jgi:hypothetical protein
MSKYDVSDAFTRMLGKPSGYRFSFRRIARLSAEQTWNGVKLLGYDIPKFLLYDALWGGFAEGLGIREHRELRAPWESEHIEEVGNGDVSEREEAVEEADGVARGDVVEGGDGVERLAVRREKVQNEDMERGSVMGRGCVGNGGVVEGESAVGQGPVLEGDKGEVDERVVASEGSAEVSLAACPSPTC